MSEDELAEGAYYVEHADGFAVGNHVIWHGDRRRVEQIVRWEDDEVFPLVILAGGAAVATDVLRRENPHPYWDHP